MNKIILEIVKESVEQYPEMRFGQILANLNIVQYKYNAYDENLIVLDPYNVSSRKILDNIRKSNLFRKLK